MPVVCWSALCGGSKDHEKMLSSSLEEICIEILISLFGEDIAMEKTQAYMRCHSRVK